MAGGPHREVAMCRRCTGRAARVSEGVETDRYRCDTCGFIFSLDFDALGPPAEPMWPPKSQERAAVLDRGEEAARSAIMRQCGELAGLAPESVRPETRLQELGDSLPKLLFITSMLQDQFAVQLAWKDLNRIKTAGELTDLLLAAPRHTLGQQGQTRKQRRRKWFLLGLVLTCCCGTPFIWVPFTVIGGRQVTSLHDGLRPGMPVAEVLGQVDRVPLWRLGLSRVFVLPQASNSTPGSDDGSRSCPVHMSLVWSHNDGPPWGRGTVPPLDEAARRLAWCDAIEFRLVVPVTRFHFLVKLKEGRITEVTPVEGEFE